MDKDLKLIIGGGLMVLGALILFSAPPDLVKHLRTMKPEEIKTLQKNLAWLQEEIKKFQDC